MRRDAATHAETDIRACDLMRLKLAPDRYLSDHCACFNGLEALQMNKVDWQQVRVLIDQIYRSTDALEGMFPGRKFTLDGHLVGSVGEVAASYMFDLDLKPASTKGHDAQTRDGRRVEIKLTQGKGISIRHEPELLLVLCRPKGESISVVYNGPGSEAWHAAGQMQKNGARPIGLTKLAALDAKIRPEQRLPLVREAPV